MEIVTKDSFLMAKEMVQVFTETLLVRFYSTANG